MAGLRKADAQRTALLPVLAEIFRTHGYEGASLARMTAAAGLGKGSLYHVFPGGKDEMTSAVLADIDGWFQREVFQPLRAQTNREADALAGIEQMFLAALQGALVLARAVDDPAVFGRTLQRWQQRLHAMARTAEVTAAV